MGDVAAVLLAEWDPLGVAETDISPEHEYRHEAAEVALLLSRSATREDVEAYLTRCGLGRPDAARDRRAAERLIALRP